MNVPRTVLPQQTVDFRERHTKYSIITVDIGSNQVLLK